MSFSFTSKGIDQVSAKLASVASDLPTEEGMALYELGSEILIESQLIVPTDIATLKNSGIVEEPVVSRGQASVKITYGGPASDYAEVQHEDLTLNHQGNGQAKYLEKPVDAARSGFTGKLASRLGRKLL